MRYAVLPFLAALAACGSSNTPSPTPTPATRTVRVVGGGGGSANLQMGGVDVSSNVRVLPYTLDQVWQAMPIVMQSLGIPIEALDPGHHTIGNPTMMIRRRLKNIPLSRYIDCGTGQMGPNADDYDVRMSVLSSLAPAEGGGTTVRTTVEAAARPANYSQEYSACSSRGSLETRLIEALQAHLARGG